MWHSAEFNTVVLKRQFKKEQSTQPHSPPPLFSFSLSTFFLYLLFSKRRTLTLEAVFFGGVEFTGNCIRDCPNEGVQRLEFCLSPPLTLSGVFIHFVVWGGQEDAHPDGLAEARAPAIGKCSVVTLQSALFVLSFLRPALVFPEAWNLKVNSWGCL